MTKWSEIPPPHHEQQNFTRLLTTLFWKWMKQSGKSPPGGSKPQSQCKSEHVSTEPFLFSRVHKTYIYRCWLRTKRLGFPGNRDTSLTATWMNWKRCVSLYFDMRPASACMLLMEDLTLFRSFPVFEERRRRLVIFWGPARCVPLGSSLCWNWNDGQHPAQWPPVPHASTHTHRVFI